MTSIGWNMFARPAAPGSGQRLVAQTTRASHEAGVMGGKSEKRTRPARTKQAMPEVVPGYPLLPPVRPGLSYTLTLDM